MSVLVIDASVAAKWYLKEEHTAAAARLLDEANELHAPDFFLLEVDSVICKWLRRGVITPSEAAEFRATMRRPRIRLHPFGRMHELAYAIANQTQRSLYDCLYVALAVRLGGRMVTADRKLYDAIAAGPFAGYVVWVEDV